MIIEDSKSDISGVMVNGNDNRLDDAFFQHNNYDVF